jgi:hypothetical protein
MTDDTRERLAPLDALVGDWAHDSRGVARVYGMSLDDGVWRLWRDGSDFSQRFTGTFSDDGTTISGAWEIALDGSRWEHDFDLVYTRVG